MIIAFFVGLVLEICRFCFWDGNIKLVKFFFVNR